MSTARSLFTEAIEEHLALKKQNTVLDTSMPLARYDVGDPLDRYPGGPARAAGAETMVVADGSDNAAMEAFAAEVDDATQLFAGPSPEQAMEAATLLEPAFDDQPIEPLNGMAPMLSLVEDIEEEMEPPVAPVTPATPVEPAGDVLRFPGGVGPREETPLTQQDTMVGAPLLPATAQQTSTMTLEEFGGSTVATPRDVTPDAPTGEQPVLVIDTNESFASVERDEPREPSRRQPKSRPRFFGLGRKKDKQPEGDNWFTDGPRDFNWD